MCWQNLTQFCFWLSIILTVWQLYKRSQPFIIYFQNLSNKIHTCRQVMKLTKKESFCRLLHFFLYFFNSFFILVMCYSVEKNFFDCFAESLIRGRFGFLQTDKVDYFAVIEYLHLKGIMLLQIYQDLLNLFELCALYVI